MSLKHYFLHALVFLVSFVVLPQTSVQALDEEGLHFLPVVASPTHPEQDAWYSAQNISLEWDVPPAAAAVRLLFDKIPDSKPTKLYEPPVDKRNVIADEDGIYYFHIQFKVNDTWGDVVHHKIQIDTKEPSHPVVVFPDGGITSLPEPQVSITATDQTSGIKDILVVIDGNATSTYPVSASSVYKFPRETPGKHTALIMVRDKANNTSHTLVDYHILPITPPKIAERTMSSEEGEIIKISGTTYPSSTVKFVYTNVKTSKSIIATTETNKDGSFLHTKKDLPVGVYEVKASVIDTQGAESGYTSAFVVSIEKTTLVRIGSFVMNWLSLMLIIILVGTLIVATFWYSMLMFARFRRKVYLRMEEAEHALRMNVAALRRDTEEFHTLLQKTQKKRELTKEELSILKKFKKRLDVTEKEIEKKLEQIG